MTSISLGWNCSSASEGVACGYRKTKAQGYKTCPFDEMNTNYDGIVRCIQDNFEGFCDPQYLALRTFPSTCPYYPNETLIVNTKYGFIFNHESPGHADLYKTQAWSGGINHFVENNFEHFRERYTRRIRNFYEYVRSGETIRFLITYPMSDMVELRRVLNATCAYTIVRFDIQDTKKFTDHVEIMKTVSSPSQRSTSRESHQTDLGSQTQPL